MIAADFPTNLLDFQTRFSTEEQCLAYIRLQRWGAEDAFECPKCKSSKCWQSLVRNILICTTCRRQVSVTSGTAFHGTRKSLRAWFMAMYLVTSSKQGLSAKELQRQLKLGSYQTAWAWLHKLRACMVNPNREPLSGEVEVDESYIGGPEPGVTGRETEKKTIMICAVEKKGAASGRVRLGVIENASRAKIKAFLNGRVEPGTLAHTDGWKGYSDLERSGYRHILTIVDGSGFKAHNLLPRVHRVFSLVKRWILGTHQGSVSRKHLPAYLEEYTFRFNRRTAKKVTYSFQRLTEGVVRAPCRPYWQITGRKTAREPLPLAMAA